MTISYDFGHGTGQDRGAEGYLNEEKEIRTYAPIAIAALQRAGHNCVNCTPTQGRMSLQESLTYRTNQANASGSSLHLCFHVNAGCGRGSEIEIAPNASSTSARVAESVLSQICALGFENRGIKTPRLWVTDHTDMPAILIEPFFCDTQADCNKYNPEALGDAIARGVISAMGGTYTPVSSGNSASGFTPNGSIKQLQSLINANPDDIPGPETLGKSPLLQVGSTGNVVKWIQYVLNSLCGAGLSIDGIFGEATRQAAIIYQKAHGLVADGIIGKATWSKILHLS
ncbi:hypothetical protein AGR56_09180 [Clostridium sp. DMHC 10]|uniref:N-acetylmuramoyl-L-alanine amidase n=1 Tax=Clostridium sp. DMHC 10 TaxID=747377 RepID=UPI00069D80FF|nr:N-acetylmuramoyl-L-alanine amidase [Clostridium sp. DMHC 10]KOF56822.1 hypothetical protein AGR56_09180 [Clostridium sp. DMHC 10]